MLIYACPAEPSCPELEETKRIAAVADCMRRPAAFAPCDGCRFSAEILRPSSQFQNQLELSTIKTATVSIDAMLSAFHDHLSKRNSLSRVVERVHVLIGGHSSISHHMRHHRIDAARMIHQVGGASL